jgi:glycerate dehydrogenase
VTFPVRSEDRSVFEEVLGEAAGLAFLGELSDAGRLAALRRAEVLLSWLWGTEVREGERGAILDVRFVQLISAGADGVPFAEIPSHIRIASNVGAYAEPMAEHVLAMVMALAKRLPERHAEMARGEFRHFAFSRTLNGAVCGILGYGGIGRAVARLMRDFGARIHALNTSGRTDDPVEFVGTLDDLDSVLSVSDVLVVALPLTRLTRGLIGPRELALMKPDAILVNVARGAIVDEAALFERLRDQPGFMAGLDAWWREPLAQGEFRTDFPFFELPNVLGSPHNSALVPGSLETAAQHAAENVLRYLRGEPVRGLVRREDYE